MKVPYQALQVARDVVLAAHGGNIVSFNANGDRLSIWRHPVRAQKSELELGNVLAALPQEETASDGPPNKRRKVENVSEAAKADVIAEEGSGQQVDTPGADQKETKEKRMRRDPGKNNREDVPIISSLLTTVDGCHVVALTGATKTIWVFEHDGAGNLKLLSERVMPKRPSSITLTSDNQTILSADKFGDVYSLPLIPAEPSTEGPDGGGGTLSAKAAPPRPFKSEANELVVHTQRNLRALQDQKRKEEQRRKESEKKAAEDASVPKFEHQLLLGHVSMLTSVLVASHGERHYIITADRDEHIRISRAPPHAHVIEGYCFGHRDFVSNLCIPASQPAILISAGGDNQIFVFDWQAGKLLSTIDLLAKVQEITPGAVKVAVSGLHSWEEQDGERKGTWVAITVERVPALFIFKLGPANTLEYSQSVSLPGNPLSIVELRSNSTVRLLAAVDPGFHDSTGESPETNTSSLRMLECGSSSDWRLSDLPFTNDASYENDGLDISADQLIKTLYSTEALRKQDHNDSGQDTANSEENVMPTAMDEDVADA